MLRAPLSTTGELGNQNGASATRRKGPAAVPGATTGTPGVASQTKQNKTKQPVPPKVHPVAPKELGPTGGQNSSIVLDQTSYGAVQKAHWGALDRTFPAPYSPGSTLSVGNHCFGPQAQVTPLWAKKSVKKVSKLNQRQGWPGGMPKGPWGPRGPWPEPGLRRF